MLKQGMIATFLFVLKKVFLAFSEPSKHPLSRIFTNQPGSLQLILSLIYEELFKFVDLSSAAQSKR